MASGSTYLIVRPEQGGILDLAKYLVLGDIRSGVKFLEFENPSGAEQLPVGDHRWVIVVSIIARKIIGFFGKPLEYTGYVVDFFLNLLSQNGNLLGLLHNLLHGKVVIPRRGTQTFLSTIGHLDDRIDLYKGQDLVEQLICDSDSGESSVNLKMGNRALMDLCMMASKLAYENAEVVKDVVHHWKASYSISMHFVDFYNCWNDFQKEMSTQVFILCDKPKDASLILISFRGTEPFDADDWSTDFDYSWYEIPKLGKVHMGFLEALGLGNRTNAETFQYHLQSKAANFSLSKSDDMTGNSSKGPESIPPRTEFGLEKNGSDNSFDSEELASTVIPPEALEVTAYYAVKSKLKSLLKDHKNAKFVVTGHSLGGALATLFPAVLLLHEEMEIMQKLLGLYTFGQPRVGNRQLVSFMEAHLDSPVPKYFRVVYCNDLVPRLPYDDKTFLYKHFGVCLYYDSFYVEQFLLFIVMTCIFSTACILKKVDEEPNKNFFGLRYLIPEHLNAVWELIRSLTMGYTYGPEYKEGWFSILLRILGLALPGISAHCPTNYVNSVRLGKERVVQMSSLERASFLNDG
ncbi:hypothetical protein Patl1_33878 [Pistacia atlantica]|uniref:Uncharacterized protein n=1 Tax=Pistacia atlantica TaxID=434234 RepID=A0ACC0ZSW8_9ROSI|nr:hypothetical protein Patl1_33878 [Pistacia atlantica]